MNLTSEEETKKKEAEQRRVEFNFPLLILRTKRLSSIFDKLGALRASRYFAWVFLVFVPFTAGIALYLLGNSLIGLILNPAVGQVARDLGPGSILLLPGLNPLLPIAYGWVAIVLAIAIHEGAHGIIARSENLRVKSSGLLFFLIIPIGAFVDVDEEQIKKARPRSSLKVMAGGVGGNVLLGVVCLVSLLVIVGGLTPIVDGVYINDVSDGMPAQAAGLMPRDVFVSIDNVKINSTDELRGIMNNKTAGDTIEVIVARGEEWQIQYSATVNLTVSENRTVMGISTYDLMTYERLQFYQTFSVDRLALYIVPPTLASGLTPFSDFLSPFYSHEIGPIWYVLANTLFWIWFVNFNLAIFNALPIYPLDGGRIFNITLKRVAGKRVSEKTIYRLTIVATLACIALVVSVTVLPFLL